VHLLLAVVSDEGALDRLLTVLVEYEALGAVVLEARTGLELLERDLPIFAGLRSLIPGGIDFCRVVLCPLPEGMPVAEVVDAIAREAGGTASAGTDRVVVLPVAAHREL